MPHQPDTATVVAARAGDPAAVDRLVADCLPLVYTIVGRALDGHADADDVVQDVLVRVLHHLGDLREPEAFRSWLVAITVRQVRDRFRVRRAAPDTLLPDDVRDPGADFTDLAITRLELSGQRRETAEATRWLDSDNRELLSLWWLEASGELTRDEIVAALGVSRQHAAVRIQRMKGQLETARVVVRALAGAPRCPGLAAVTADWDGRPGALWRKRIARHTRDCRRCGSAWSDLVAAERLLAGMALVPVPHSLGAAVDGSGAAATAAAAGATGHAGAGTIAARTTSGISRRVLTAVLATTAVAGGAAAVAIHRSGEPPVSRAAAVVTADPAPSRPAPAPAATSTAPSLAPSRSRPAPTRATAAPAVGSAKKGVGVWQFAGAEAALGDVGAGWYYTWGPGNDDLPGPAGVEFVPMIWGADNVTDRTLAQVRREGKVLLGFNEPDLAEQADLTVERALQLWPRLESTGLRLGSPAVAFGADVAGGWLDRFMTGARQRDLRVDFIALHWYGSDFGPGAVEHFLSYVDAVHERYGKPIWVTEYGLINFTGTPKYPTGAQAAAFIAGSTRGMQRRSYVHRYAWFGLPAVGDSAAFGLYRDGSTPTDAGKAYRAAG